MFAGNGLRFIVRVRSGVRLGTTGIVPEGTCLGLILAAPQVLTQLCGQSLLAQLRLFRFAHGLPVIESMAG
jgi:hypothetical protein